MKPLLITLYMAVLPLPVLAQTGTPTQTSTIRYSKDEKAVLAVHEARRAAMLGNDIPAMEKLLNERVSYIHSSGKADNRADFLGSLKSGTLRYERIEQRNTTIQASGNLSMVSGEITIQVKNPERTLTFDAYYTAIYVRDKKNGWQLLRWQTTRLPAPEPPK